MRITIDRAGRLVVPKAIRDQVGLRLGAEVEITARGGRIEIEPAEADIRLETRGTRPVFVSDVDFPPLTPEEVREPMEKLRR